MENKKMDNQSYRTLLLMSLVSLPVMYAVMFLNVDDISHVYLSLTRLYMSLLMVSPMALLMLLMMKKMFVNRKKNIAIVIISATVFISSLVCLRTQAFISDNQYMKAMIPHHSSAIMTSKHAGIRDSSVKKLSMGIIESQQKEIAEMKAMLDK